MHTSFPSLYNDDRQLTVHINEADESGVIGFELVCPGREARPEGEGCVDIYLGRDDCLALYRLIGSYLGRCYSGHGAQEAQDNVGA